jgi:hypothetical protein
MLFWKIDVAKVAYDFTKNADVSKFYAFLCFFMQFSVKKIEVSLKVYNSTSAPSVTLVEKT